MTITLDSLGQAGAVLAAVLAFVTVVAWAVRVGLAIRRLLTDLANLAARELRHNGGGSIKDDVHGIAVSVGELSRRVNAIEQQLTELKGPTH